MFIKEVTRQILNLQYETLNKEDEIVDNLVNLYDLGDKDFKFYYTQKLQIITSKEQINKTLKELEDKKCENN